jgi:hypothetical protein
MPLKLTQTHQCAQCYGCDAEIKHRQPVSTCAPTHTHIHICTHTHTHARTRMRPAMLYVMLKGSTGGLPSTNTPTYIHTYTHTHIQMCQANFYVMLKVSTACLLSTHKRQTQTKTQVQTHLFDNTLSHTHTQTSLAMMNAQASTFKHTHTPSFTLWKHAVKHTHSVVPQTNGQEACFQIFMRLRNVCRFPYGSTSVTFLKQDAHNVHTRSIVIRFQSSLHQRTRIQHTDVLK